MSTQQWICFLNSRDLALEEKISLLEQEYTGSKLYYGNSSPNNAVGLPGDLYLQFDGAFLYSKQGAIWEFEGEIKARSIDGGKIL